MAHQEIMPDDFDEFEQQLAAVPLRSVRLNRARLMYLAGRASVSQKQSRRWFWPSSTAVMTLAAFTLAMINLAQPVEVRYVDRVAPKISLTPEPYVLSPKEATAVEDQQRLWTLPQDKTTADQYRRAAEALRIRALAFEQGIDALPESTYPVAVLSAEPLTSRDLERELQNNSPIKIKKKSFNSFFLLPSYLNPGGK